MVEQQLQFDDLSPLLAALCDGAIDGERFARLERLLATDAAARQWYLAYMDLHGELCWDHTGNKKAARGQWLAASESETPNPKSQIPNQQISNPQSPIPNPSVVPFFLDTSSALPSPLFSLPSFVGSPLFSYLVAALIVGLGLLIASTWKLTGSPEIAQQSLPPAGQRVHEPEPTLDFVGRITGLVDCRWADDSTAILDRTNVRLGRRFTLASGLMEITYDTGAKVILQGPATYEVESNGGYLAVGKLTGKLEMRNDEARMTNVEGKHEIRMTNDQRLQNSSFVIRPSSFVIHTPTATVTDLGTEFGIEVSKDGYTTSRVFRGSVALKAVSVDGESESVARVLRENESARVEGGGNRIVMLRPSAKPTDFVRALSKPTIKTLDLVDVVAGGDGFSGRRNRGIDPTSGRATDVPPPSNAFLLTGDKKYHRVEGLPFIDGVFIPDGGARPVQVDSAGHTFAEWIHPTANQTYGYLWAGGRVPAVPGVTLRTELGGIDYATDGHGLIFLHANNGITFDLAAIRRANPGCQIMRFRAMTGNTEPVSAEDEAVWADVWVLVDGQLRFRRREINGCTGAFSLAIPIAENDRFLTLASTDGGNGISWDWIVFGDPRLELTPIPAAAEPQYPNSGGSDDKRQTH